MTGWGAPAELINPATAANKFLDQMVKVADWQTLSPWTVAQDVQGSPSSDGGIYRDSYQQATVIVAALDATSAALADATAGSLPAAVIQAATIPNCGRPAAAAVASDGSAAWGGYQNGRIPSSALCPVPSATTLQLECRAAAAFDQLNTAFKAAVGQNIGITDGYRSDDDQVQCRLEKGSLCANPGSSNHGWGKAVDIGACCGINTGAGAAFDWLTTNASRYGWTASGVGTGQRLQT